MSAELEVKVAQLLDEVQLLKVAVVSLVESMVECSELSEDQRMQIISVIDPECKGASRVRG